MRSMGLDEPYAPRWRRVYLLPAFTSALAAIYIWRLRQVDTFHWPQQVGVLTQMALYQLLGVPLHLHACEEGALAERALEGGVVACLLRST